MKTRLPIFLAFVSAALLVGCRTPGDSLSIGVPAGRAIDAGSFDPHSFSRPDRVLVRHIALDLDVDFDNRRLAGTVMLFIENRARVTELVLDTKDLEILGVSIGHDRKETSWRMGDEQPFMGRPLQISIKQSTSLVTVTYRTSPAAAALQWLPPEQTAGKKLPFLFTQSQAILARTWVPCQDTPAVRMTYEARVRVPPGMIALMSAENPTTRSEDGVYRFRMPQAIPSYLLALAVGDLEFRPFDGRSGVYAEPEVIENAAWELADTPRMMEVAESLYGPYRWGRYDVLVLPPSFPYGGMENPRLTFATPTILAGDRSLVSLVAHELAHSWSGNLVTNATWNDFWLNEGFTSYIELRIMEALSGRDYSEMLATLSLQELHDELGKLGAQNPDTRLHLDLAGRDPDEGTTSIAYDKGQFFLRLLEEIAGRERFDEFLRDYFDRFAFRSMDTAGFVSFLDSELIRDDEELERRVAIEEWIFAPGLPDNLPRVSSTALSRVDREIQRFGEGISANGLDTLDWNTHQWRYFLRGLPTPMSYGQMEDLDRAFEFSTTGNSEVLNAWLLAAIENRYEPAYPALERFLTGMGRRRFLLPLYEALARTAEGRDLAGKIYAKARPGYHSISQGTIDAILDWNS